MDCGAVTVTLTVTVWETWSALRSVTSSTLECPPPPTAVPCQRPVLAWLVTVAAALWPFLVPGDTVTVTMTPSVRRASHVDVTTARTSERRLCHLWTAVNDVQD